MPSLSSGDSAAICKALSDPNRMKIIDMLSCGELCACRLLEHFHITQPTLSHHMKVLVDCGLVRGRKEGVWMHYSLNRERVDAFLQFLNLLASDKDDCICRQASCDGEGEKKCYR